MNEKIIKDIYAVQVNFGLFHDVLGYTVIFISFIYTVLFVYAIKQLLIQSFSNTDENIINRIKLITRFLLLLITTLWIFEFTQNTQNQFMNIAYALEHPESKQHIMAYVYQGGLTTNLTAIIIFIGTFLQTILEIIFQFRNKNNNSIQMPNE